MKACMRLLDDKADRPMDLHCHRAHISVELVDKTESAVGAESSMGIA